MQHVFGAVTDGLTAVSVQRVAHALHPTRGQGPCVAPASIQAVPLLRWLGIDAGQLLQQAVTDLVGLLRRLLRVE